jgi:hypothetical protein
MEGPECAGVQGNRIGFGFEVGAVMLEIRKDITQDQDF